MNDDPRRQIWTREGRVPLRHAWEVNSLGVGREERTTTMVNQYAERQPTELCEPIRDVYVRAYRRAGLLPGNPDEIETRLPTERAEEPKPPDDTESQDTGV